MDFPAQAEYYRSKVKGKTLVETKYNTRFVVREPLSHEGYLYVCCIEIRDGKVIGDGRIRHFMIQAIKHRVDSERYKIEDISKSDLKLIEKHED